MKKATLLASLAALTIAGTIAGNAAALPEDGLEHPISVAGFPAGFASFFFTANVGGVVGGFCSFIMDWLSPLPIAGSANCLVQEQKALGATACIPNTRLPGVTTVVTSLPLCCQGFDQFGLIENVSLVLTESGLVGTPLLTGVALFEFFPAIPRPIFIA